MNYVYIPSERNGQQGATNDLFTVGFYDPKGKWYPESDHVDSEKAAARVAYLNGDSSKALGDVLASALCEIRRILLLRVRAIRTRSGIPLTDYIVDALERAGRKP